MDTYLSVNLNAVAMLRNRRDLPWPSVTGVARVVLDAGAYGITVHPRADERHIRRSDVHELNDLLNADYAHKEYNIEGYPSPDWLALVEATAPTQATLVPDTPEQSTSDHGWDLQTHRDFLAPIVARLKGKGIRVALFVDPQPTDMGTVAEIGADRIELYTGPYGGAFGTAAADAYLARMADTATAAGHAGLGINAGHDLTFENLPTFIAAVPHVLEVSIGHGITADALLYGFETSVQRYIAALERPDTMFPSVKGRA